MPVSGYVNVEFMKYVLYGGVINANPKAILYKYDATTGKFTKFKELPATCQPIDVSGGIGILCEASDTSQDEYTADSVVLGRSSFTVDGETSESVVVFQISTFKARDQKLEVKFRAQLRA